MRVLAWPARANAARNPFQSLLYGALEGQGGAEVAAVSKRWLTLRDTYAVQVAAGVEPLLVIGAVLALDLAMEREEKKARDQHE